VHLDFHHRPTLLKSWLATLHGPNLTVRPRTVGPLPAWRELLPTAVAWHVAYALLAYAGALVVARSDSSSALAGIVRGGGLAGTLLLALAVWWGGVALSTGLWWAGVVRVRQTVAATSRQD
jgi:hypothetical protein